MHDNSRKSTNPVSQLSEITIPCYRFSDDPPSLHGRAVALTVSDCSDSDSSGEQGDSTGKFSHILGMRDLRKNHKRKIKMKPLWRESVTLMVNERRLDLVQRKLLL